MTKYRYKKETDEADRRVVEYFSQIFDLTRTSRAPLLLNPLLMPSFPIHNLAKRCELLDLSSGEHRGVKRLFYPVHRLRQSFKRRCIGYTNALRRAERVSGNQSHVCNLNQIPAPGTAELSPSLIKSLACARRMLGSFIMARNMAKTLWFIITQAVCAQRSTSLD